MTSGTNNADTPAAARIRLAAVINVCVFIVIFLLKWVYFLPPPATAFSAVELHGIQITSLLWQAGKP
jgi:hypothetical protein